MGATGTTTIDFGAFPGSSDASVDVTGQTGILTGSLVEAWIRPVATSDHTDTEHMVETLRVVAGNISAGVGFTIYGFNTSQLNEPLGLVGVVGGRGAVNSGATSGIAGPLKGSGGVASRGGMGTMLYGQFTVAWVWS